MKGDFEEKLLGARGGKELLNVEKQQMTAEKQELASKTFHLSEEVLLRLRHGLMCRGWVTAGQRLCSQRALSLSGDR